MMTDMASSPPAFFKSDKEAIDKALIQVITELAGSASTLAKAVRYSTMPGGKRIRPLLVLASAECFGAGRAQALIPACAVELVHAYSLTHDDLPAMDNDDLRRGQATCHRAFDEATAILTGDALQTMAFELISNEGNLSDKKRLKMIQVLSTASGPRGMVLGQTIDLESVGQQLNLSELENMHFHKTGALIEASVLLGALCGDAGNSELEALKEYARAIGLAFQVQDDILDVTGDTRIIGKQQGADAALDKPTYPALLGLEGARNTLLKLHQQASRALSRLEGRGTTKLTAISDFIITRHR